MAASDRSRFLTIVHSELKRLGEWIADTERSHSEALEIRPELERLTLAELITVIGAQIETISGCRVHARAAADLWLAVDTIAFTAAFHYLAGKVNESAGISQFALEAAAAGRNVHIDLCWNGRAIAAERLASWERTPNPAFGGAKTLTLHDVFARNGAEFWQETSGAQVRLRFMLRILAQPEPFKESASAPRPIFYDFDLFDTSNRHLPWDDLPLAQLAYTAFDTETTGLEPSAGDEIISIGAVRILNARILENECFDQLIDPRRPIARDAVKIHGIHSAMLAGQPHIDAVLPAFARFCEDTVLLGHNVAFDLRFLKLKERSSGTRFRHPLLDTLLLSAVLHQAQDSHRLEALARRFGVQVIARHTALGDAMLTAEVFLRMIPLLAAKGISTLGQAREASRLTPYARLSY
jgi:DNA polymerase-3 subunit epsilon